MGPRPRYPIAVSLALLLAATSLDARTVYRCVRDGTVSLATAPEAGSSCKAYRLADNAALPRNLWGTSGGKRGTLYRREQDGRIVYGTRNLPGSVAVQTFSTAPRGSPAHRGLGLVGPPRLGVYVEQFRAAARATGTDEAWLRAIAHAESGFDASAVSPKGARGIMQLMPATAEQHRVTDPFDASQSIHAGARQLRELSDRYEGDLVLVAAAYNAGEGAVDRFGGVPPYAETQDYVGKVLALHARYRAALKTTGTATASPGS